MRMYRSSILGLRSASKYPRLDVVVLGLVLGDDLPAEPAAALAPCPQFRLLLLAEEPATVEFGELEVRHTFVDEPDEVALHGLCRSDSAHRLRGLPDVGPELRGDGFDRPWKVDPAEPQQAKEKEEREHSALPDGPTALPGWSQPYYLFGSLQQMLELDRCLGLSIELGVLVV